MSSPESRALNDSSARICFSSAIFVRRCILSPTSRVAAMDSHATRAKYPLPAPLRRAASPGASSFGESRLEGWASPQATTISSRKTFNGRFNTSLSRSLRYTVADPPPALLGVLLGASDKGLHTPDGEFDVNMGVECNRGSSKLLKETGIKSVRGCREACAAQVECVAAELDQVLGKCMLWRECLYREPAMRFGSAWGKRRATSGIRVMHRVGRPWPVPAGQVVWRANATIVVASYTYRLDWLRTVPNAFDVALYHKHDFVASPSGRARTMSDERLPLHFMRDRPQLCFNFRSATHPRVGFPLDPCQPGQCNCSTGRNDDHRLAYYRVLPNYGRTDGKIRANGDNHNAPGGSREPYPYLLFILEFWDNLPNVLIFTQDDCVHKTCTWMISAPRSIAMLQNWRQHWGEPLAPTRYNCMCRYMVEHNYDRTYFWHNWMSTLQCAHA